MGHLNTIRIYGAFIKLLGQNVVYLRRETVGVP